MLSTLIALALLPGAPNQSARVEASPGQLSVVDKDGRVGNLCPLQGTRVQAQIAGLGAEVKVVQTFINPTSEPIEAVYTFPLPHDAAVNGMRIRVGDRLVEGLIKRREEARRIYEDARQAGQVAALLDQERPNIFTQTVANIMPNAKVDVEISYVQMLKYEGGQFEFSYPMVVGPRFLGNSVDSEKIDPPRLLAGIRSGATIDLTVNIAAGAPIRDLKSELHDVKVETRDNKAKIILKRKDEIPNRDFILRYRLAGEAIQTAFVSHMDPGSGGYFALMVMPPQTPRSDQIAPRELIFVVDQSGSQRGFPIEKSRALTLAMLKQLRPGDTFDVLGFSDSVRMLWPSPKKSTPETIAQAEAFVAGLEANGGTQLRIAVEAALALPADPERLRLLVFNTDGFVGDEKRILESIRQHRAMTRMFTFGIGNSVNRYLIDAMSSEGKGAAEYVILNSSSDAAVARFVKRTQTPVLTDVKVTVNGNGVSEILPNPLADVFADQPVMVYGRYDQAGPAKVTITGMLGGKLWTKTVDVQFEAKEQAPAIETLWARNKINALELEMYYCGLDEKDKSPIVARITEHALNYNLMSAFTSFVAVESKVVNINGKQRRVRVPVEMADGVVAGQRQDLMSPMALKAGSRGGLAGGGGVGGGGASLGQAAGNAKFRSEAELDVSGSPIATREERFNQKVSKKLAKSKGAVEVQILLRTLDKEVEAALTKAGLKIEATDGTLKVVFGTCDAKALMEIAQISAVTMIKELD